MPLRNYGVLAARVVDQRREEVDDSPFYHLHLVDAEGIAYRASVNVQSLQAPSELLYVVIDDFRGPVLDRLPAAGSGWRGLASQPDAEGLDFIRGNLFDPSAMRAVPPDLPPGENDLADLLDHFVLRAINDSAAAVYVFGEHWGPEPDRPDRVFGFVPGNGIHDIHMNQGSTSRFRRDDGVWQDGGVLIHLPSESRWIAVFVAFQSQAWHTDDTTGHMIDAPPPRPADQVEWVFDTPAQEDRLRRRPLATALARRLSRSRQDEPDLSFLLHIDGAWGTGKSTLVNLLRTELPREWLPVDFNAWRQTNVGPAWWALLVALRQGITDKTPTLRGRLRLRLAESWMRLRREQLALAVLLLLLIACAALLLLGRELATVTTTVTAVVTAVGALWAAARFVGRFLQWDSARGARLFEQSNANPMRDIAEHFAWLVAKAPGPVIFFIDDLDRCSESYVVELLDAVQTLVRDTPSTTAHSRSFGRDHRGSVFFVVAADGSWIRKSYEVAYEKFADSVAEPGRPLGHLFLDKLFQLRVSVPLIDAQRKQYYLARLLRLRSPTDAEAVRQEIKRTRDLLTNTTTDDGILRIMDSADPAVYDQVADLAVIRLTDALVERATEHRLQRFESLLAPNPRSMKRFVNAYSMLRAVRILEGSTVPFDPLALWTIIETRWPGLADHLRAHPEAILSLNGMSSDRDIVPVTLRALLEDPDVRRVTTFELGGPLTPELIRACCGESLPAV
ncbi:DUF2278 family protein [Streptomyces olivochromogenes]|uniref:DUF2278 family protein n=1 Tax=Streptomyces olivochromogenes TaxID=1963 RepID=UPI0036D812AC